MNGRAVVPRRSRFGWGCMSACGAAGNGGGGGHGWSTATGSLWSRLRTPSPVQPRPPKTKCQGCHDPSGLVGAYFSVAIFLIVSRLCGTAVEFLASNQSQGVVERYRHLEQSSFWLGGIGPSVRRRNLRCAVSV